MSTFLDKAWIEKVKYTAYLRGFGLFKVPMIFWLSPTVYTLNQNEVSVCIKLQRRSKNHLGSMYFGALAVGADCAGGLLAVKFMDELQTHYKKKISLVFKDFNARFLKRPDDDVYFTCKQGTEIYQFVKQTYESDQRQNMTVHVQASTKKDLVAEFELTLSLKVKA